MIVLNFNIYVLYGFIYNKAFYRECKLAGWLENPAHPGDIQTSWRHPDFASSYQECL